MASIRSKELGSTSEMGANAAAQDAAPSGRPAPLGNLVTLRMIRLFGLMRRSGALAQRREFDLSEIEWRIITQVGAFAPLSLNGLADLLLLDRGQLSRAVKGMVERGLLKRERKPGGPEIQIEMTEQGHDLYQDMVKRTIERDHRLTRGMPEDDLETIRRVVDIMIVRAEELLEDERAQEAL